MQRELSKSQEEDIWNYKRSLQLAEAYIEDTKRRNFELQFTDDVRNGKYNYYRRISEVEGGDCCDFSNEGECPICDLHLGASP
jgi:hypothetical protein